MVVGWFCAWTKPVWKNLLCFSVRPGGANATQQHEGMRQVATDFACTDNREKQGTMSTIPIRHSKNSLVVGGEKDELVLRTSNCCRMKHIQRSAMGRAQCVYMRLDGLALADTLTR